MYRFFSADPQKTALKYQGREISYGELYQEIQRRASWLRQHPADYLLCHASEAENLVNFLALIYTGQKGVFCGKNVSQERKLAYAEKYNLGLLDFIPEAPPADSTSYQPAANDYFLGIINPGKGGIIWKDYQSWFSAFPAQSEVFGMHGHDRVMVVDALGYSANLNTVIHALWLGATVVLTSLREAKNWANLIRDEEITSLFLVPSHYRLLPENRIFPGLTSAVSAGEKLDPALAEKLLRIFPEARLTEYYGAAELGHISYLQNREIIEKPTSVGRPFPGVTVHIRQEKIWVESPYVSPGYRHIPTVSDLGFIDPEGHLWLLGRDGQMFHRRELNLFAEEIEHTPGLCTAAAMGSPLISSLPAAPPGLQLVRDEPLSQDELHLFLLKKTTREQLSGHTLFPESLPRNSSGKVNFKILSKKPVDEDSPASIPCALCANHFVFFV